MGACLINLFLITAFFIYLNAIHDGRIRLEVRMFPIYGAPFLFFLTSVFAGLIYVVCYVTVVIAWEFALFSVVVISTCAAIGLPLLAYLFFWRLRKYRRRAHEKEEAPTRDLLLLKLKETVNALAVEGATHKVVPLAEAPRRRLSGLVVPNVGYN